MKEKEYYVNKFAKYPDLLTIEQFRKIFAGMSDTVARRLLRENRVEHFLIRHTYYIPKVSAIEFAVSEEYEKLKKKLRHKLK